jgi:hypothetical protein
MSQVMNLAMPPFAVPAAIAATVLAASLGGAAAARPAAAAGLNRSQDRPISGSLRRPSIGRERIPDMLLRPDSRTNIVERRQLILPQVEICRDELVRQRSVRRSEIRPVRRCRVP